MKIELTRGYSTEIDGIDADLADLKWTASEKSNGVYVVRGGGGRGAKQIRLHRVIMSRIIGSELPDDIEVDHIDNDPLNNCRSNLRVATRTQNNQNKRPQSNNRSGTPGVSWCSAKGKWAVYTYREHKSKLIGRFEDIAEAIRARNEAVSDEYGEYGKQYEANS